MLNQPTCICCLSVNGKLFSIHEVENFKLYLDAVGLSVVLGDRLPQHVCLPCLLTLRKFSHFRQQCRSVLNMLCRVLDRDTQGNEYNQTLASLHQQIKPAYMISKTLTMEISGSDDEDDDDDDDDLIPSQEASVQKELIMKNTTPVLQQNNDVNMEMVGAEDDSNNAVPFDESDCQYLEEEYLEDDFDINEDVGERGTKINNQVVQPEKKKRGRPKIKVATEAPQPKIPQYAILSDIRLMTEFAESLGFDVKELSREEQVNEIEEKKRRPGLICELCGNRYSNSYCMKRHKSFHMPRPKSFTCDLCSWVFRRKTRFMEHKLTHRFKFSCKHCDFKTHMHKTLDLHCRFHKGKKYTCKYCSRVFDKITSHLSHVRYTHHAELPWCDLCGEAFIGEKGVRNHKKLTHSKLEEYPFKCECDKSFRSQDALDRHVLVEGCGLPSCVQCGESLPSPSLLKHHLTQRHVGGALPAARQCAVCVSRFYSQEALQRHQCGGVACAVCGESFHDTKSLEEHVLTDHEQFECYKCGRKFDAKRYREHAVQDICHKEKGKGHNGGRVPMDFCRLTQPKNIVYKWRILDDNTVRREAPPPRPAPPRRAVCEVCGKGYKSEAHLKLHACPFAERTLACRVCGKLFKTKVLLRNHETTTHSEERSFLCSHCPSAFKTISGLYRHQLVHTGQRNHMCTVCGKRFMTSTCVKLHMKTVHLKMVVQRKKRQRRKKEKRETDSDTE